MGQKHIALRRFMLTTEQIKKTVADYFKDKPVKKVYLFGSYARGEAGENSDIDLCFEFEPGANISYFTLAKYLLDLEKKLNTKIDLVEEKLIYEGIKTFIDQSKILILENED